MLLTIEFLAIGVSWFYAGYWFGRCREQRSLDKQIDDAIDELMLFEELHSTEYDKHEYSAN